MATQLGVYNEALRLLSEDSLATLTDDVEARYVLDDLYDGAVAYCLSQGWWRFAMTHSGPTASASGHAEFPYTFDLPAGWLRTHSVTVINGTRAIVQDYRQVGDDAIRVKVNASSLTLNYLSDDATEADWPEVFAKFVAADLAFEAVNRLAHSKADRADLAKILADRLGVARTSESEPPPRILREHACERVARAQLEQGLWKFALVTAELTANSDTPSPPYAYAFDKPAAWMRTSEVFRLLGSSTMQEIDFRDEGGDLHADYSPVYLRYVSTAALDATTWPELFITAYDAGLRYEEAIAAGAPESEIAARLRAWQVLIAEAKVKDGLNDRPRVNNIGRFNLARRRGASSSIRSEQGF